MKQTYLNCYKNELHFRARSLTTRISFIIFLSCHSSVVEVTLRMKLKVLLLISMQSLRASRLFIWHPSLRVKHFGDRFSSSIEDIARRLKSWLRKLTSYSICFVLFLPLLGRLSWSSFKNLKIYFDIEILESLEDDWELWYWKMISRFLKSQFEMNFSFLHYLISKKCAKKLDKPKAI